MYIKQLITKDNQLVIMRTYCANGPLFQRPNRNCRSNNILHADRSVLSKNAANYNTINLFKPLLSTAEKKNC